MTERQGRGDGSIRDSGGSLKRRGQGVKVSWVREGGKIWGKGRKKAEVEG